MKSTISVDWMKLKKRKIQDGDFYLADLLSYENLKLKEKLSVILEYKKYKIKVKTGEVDLDELHLVHEAPFNDNQKAHIIF